VHMGVTEVVAGFNLRTLYASYRIGCIYAQTASQQTLLGKSKTPGKSASHLTCEGQNDRGYVSDET
jgi:hypothetical protein